MLSNNSENNVEEVHHIKKGMFPFNCFNYGKVGNCSTKCSFGKNGSRDDKEDYNSFEESNTYISDKDERNDLFMTMETKLDTIKK